MENIIKIIKESKSYNDALKKLKWGNGSYAYKKIKKIIKENNISTSHYIDSKEALEKYHKEKTISLNKILIENSTYTNRDKIKKKLISNNLMEYKCVFCENPGIWLGKKISLILDHINGIKNDNRIENLRLVCPNCNATLDTHCGKNIKKKNPKKIKKTPLEVQKPRRTIERPPLNVLLEEIKNLGYSATGKKYGVSDNAIRKWIVTYKKYGE
jgi:5-methylcytosine-specific restriction endonuclease McrA